MFDPWSPNAGLAANQSQPPSAWSDLEEGDAVPEKTPLGNLDGTFEQISESENTWLNMAEFEGFGGSSLSTGVEAASFLSIDSFTGFNGEEAASSSLQDLCKGVTDQTLSDMTSLPMNTQKRFVPSPLQHNNPDGLKTPQDGRTPYQPLATGMKHWLEPRSGSDAQQSSPPLKELQTPAHSKLKFASKPTLLPPPPAIVPMQTLSGCGTHSSPVSGRAGEKENRMDATATADAVTGAVPPKSCSSRSRNRSGRDGARQKCAAQSDIAAAKVAAALAQASAQHLQKQLCDAIKQGNLEAVRTWLEEGADPSECAPDDPLRSPVYLAAMEGHDGIVQLLLERKADPNKARSDIGATPLYTAAGNGHDSVVQLLCEHGADPNQARTDIQATPLYISAACGHLNVVKVLLAHNGAPNEARVTDGCTPLYMAAQNGHVDVVKTLQEHYANPNQARDDVGATPLHVAAQNGHLSVVVELLGNQADPNKTTKKTGATPISMAAYNGHPAVVSTLLEHGANPNQANYRDATTPLYMACGQGFEGIASMLLEYNADPNQALTSDGTTNICIAAKHGHLGLVKILLDHNADPNIACSNNGATPLYISAQNDHIDVVRMLLAHNADPNKARTDGGNGTWTPLKMAESEGNAAVVTLLLQHHASF